MNDDEYYRRLLPNTDKSGKIFHVVLGGTADPPPRIRCGKETSNYRLATIKDIEIVEHAIDWTSDSTNRPNICVVIVADTALTTWRALKEINKAFLKAMLDTESEFKTIEICFTGHGNSSGNWCFSNGRVTLREIMNIAKKYRSHFDCLNLVSSACKSGNWCQQLEQWSNEIDFDVDICASSWPDRASYSDNDGSYFIRFMYRKNEVTNPKNERYETRWTHASLTKEGTYTMTRGKAEENVEAEVQSIPGKMNEIESIVKQIEGQEGRNNHLISKYGWYSQFWSASIQSELYDCQRILDSLASAMCSLKTKIDRIQGPSYLKSAALSDKSRRYLTWALVRERERTTVLFGTTFGRMQVRRQRIIRFLLNRKITDEYCNYGN